MYSVYIYILLGKVRTLLEWADGLPSKKLDGWLGEWSWSGYPIDCLDYQSTCGANLALLTNSIWFLSHQPTRMVVEVANRNYTTKKFGWKKVNLLLGLSLKRKQLFVSSSVSYRLTCCNHYSKRKNVDLFPTLLLNVWLRTTVLQDRPQLLPISFTWESEKRQDKVNYAVSEREDRVTDLTTLTRMTGCTGLCWAVLGCTGL